MRMTEDKIPKSFYNAAAWKKKERQAKGVVD